MDKVLELELEMELRALRQKIIELERENRSLKDILVENDLAEEIGVFKQMTPEEEICVLGIEQILQLVRNKTFDKTDVVNFDILNKNLRMIRGQISDVRKEKKTSKADLLKIVEGSNG